MINKVMRILNANVKLKYFPLQSESMGPYESLGDSLKP